MKAKTKILGSLCFIFSCNLYAAEIPKALPQDLMYNDKPIDPLCFFENDEKKPWLPLSECGINSEPNRQVSDQQSALASKGYIGYEYSWPADQNNGQPNCYSYYKMIGNLNGSYIIFALNNSGGSGQFSGIYLVKRQGDAININLLAGGDRCNNGINTVKQKDNKIIYNTNITAADFFDLANQKTNENLSFCAACCAATANIEIDPMQKTSKLLSIDLEKKVVDESEPPNTAQYCFNKLLNEYVATGNHSMSPSELNQFVKKFIQVCAKAPA